MEETYRPRVCPICGGVVRCDLQSTSAGDYEKFNVVFVAECEGCGLNIAGNKSTMFKLFKDRKPSKLVQQAFFDEDNKWVYQTSTYRNLV